MLLKYVIVFDPLLPGHMIRRMCRHYCGL